MVLNDVKSAMHRIWLMLARLGRGIERPATESPGNLERGAVTGTHMIDVQGGIELRQTDQT